MSLTGVLTLYLSEVASPTSMSTATYSHLAAFRSLRYLYLENQPSIFEALENSIVESGGACQRLQTDNAKSFVINASKNNL